MPKKSVQKWPLNIYVFFLGPQMASLDPKVAHRSTVAPINLHGPAPGTTWAISVAARAPVAVRRCGTVRCRQVVQWRGVRGATPGRLGYVHATSHSIGPPGAAQLPLPLSRARDEAYSQGRARAIPAGSGLANANAARREPGLPVSPLWGRPQAAGPREGKALGASRWLCGQALGYCTQVAAYLAAPALPRALRREPPAPPASHPSGAADWPGPKPAVVIGGAPEENGFLLLILATS
jgi:hypothetical protein